MHNPRCLSVGPWSSTTYPQSQEDLLDQSDKVNEIRSVVYIPDQRTQQRSVVVQISKMARQYPHSGAQGNKKTINIPYVNSLKVGPGKIFIGGKEVVLHEANRVATKMGDVLCRPSRPKTPLKRSPTRPNHLDLYLTRKPTNPIPVPTHRRPVDKEAAHAAALLENKMLMQEVSDIYEDVQQQVTSSEAAAKTAFTNCDINNVITTSTGVDIYEVPTMNLMDDPDIIEEFNRPMSPTGLSEPDKIPSSQVRSAMSTPSPPPQTFENGVPKMKKGVFCFGDGCPIVDEDSTNCEYHKLQEASDKKKMAAMKEKIEVLKTANKRMAE